jgi:hypothetical protein
MLDDAKIKTERAGIQLKNVGYPIGIAVFLGIIIHFIRRRKFASNPK